MNFFGENTLLIIAIIILIYILFHDGNGCNAQNYTCGCQRCGT